MNPRSGTAAPIAFVLLATLFMAACEAPPMESVQRGYRGTGMELVINPTLLDESLGQNMPPEALPQVPAGGPKAGEVYQNVQVLGDLSAAEFSRLMAAITQWVSPEQGCNYCHEGANFAEDNVYTKKVARTMLAMTQRINQDWQSHVSETGVTCYTCHRGKNVPEYVWSEEPGHTTNRVMVSASKQNIASPSVGYASLPYDVFSYFVEQENVRVASNTALPTGSTQNIMDAEHTYALMMHFSGALGVNCTYCHNSRNFSGWEGSPSQRVTAWHGVQMVREVNDRFIIPTAPWLPENRLGPLGDVPKANCATCHQGVFKPLYGAQMLKAYPNLGRLDEASQEAYLDEGG